MYSLTRRIAMRLASHHRLLFLLPACQIGAILWLIWTHTSPMPYLDEWELANFLELAEQGRLRLVTFLAFQNEHRIVIPRLLLFALIRLTDWDRPVLMTVNLGIATATVALVLGGIRRTLGTRGFAVIFVPCSLLLLSFAHFENWLFAFQTNFILAVWGVACCLWGLAPALPDRAWRTWRFWLAVLGAIVASLSTLGGLLTWPAFLLAVWRGGRGARWAWCLCALAIIIPYFIGFPSRTSPKESLLTYTDYLLVYLGSPLADSSVILARLWGIAGFALMAALLVKFRRDRKDLWQIAAWIGLACFALGNALLSSYGRAYFGLEQALSSRYRLFSTLWWVALLVLGWLTIQGASGQGTRSLLRREALIGLGVGVSLMLGLVQANLGGFKESLVWQKGLRQHESCVLEYYVASDDCLLMFYASAPITRIHAAFLEQHRLAGFREATIPDLTKPPRTEAVLSIIDTINDLPPSGGPILVAPDAPLVIRGWAVDAAARAPASAVYITVDDRYTYRAEYGDDRPDVAAATNVPAYERSGFTAGLPAGMLGPGRYAIAIAIVGHDGQTYATNSQHVTVVIRAAQSRKTTTEKRVCFHLDSVPRISQATIRVRPGGDGARVAVAPSARIQTATSYRRDAAL